MYIRFIFNKASKFTEYRKSILMYKNEVGHVYYTEKKTQNVIKTKTYNRNYKTIRRESSSFNELELGNDCMDLTANTQATKAKNKIKFKK